MTVFVVMLALVLLWTEQGASQTFSVASGAIAGGASPDLRTPLMGFQVEARATSEAYAGSAAYRWVRLQRTCKTSLPPQCVVDTPGGYLLLLGGSRVMLGGTIVSLRAGVETGVARLRENSEIGRDTYAAFGARAEVEFPVERLLLRLGGVIDWTEPAWLGGAIFAIGVRL